MLYFVAVNYALQLNICHKMECKFAVLIALDIKDCIKSIIKGTQGVFSSAGTQNKPIYLR